MKFVIVFVALIAAAFAASPQLKIAPSGGEAQILRQESHIQPDGYSYSWETSDGASASESGQVRNIGKEDASIAANGQFSFVAPDGQTYSVQYVADEHGFQPSGAHLPV